MKHLYLVRHGEAVLNTQGVFAGQTETPLTDKGREQAHQAGAQATELAIDLIVSSPLSRAYDTACSIAAAIGYPAAAISIDERLTERSFGSAEGAPWAPDFDMEAVADAEPLDALEQRVRAFYDYLQTLPAENILVVSHGSTGRMLRSIVQPEIPFHGTTAEHHLPNAHINQLL